MEKQNKWTREETIIAFNVYCKIPFKQSSKTNPVIMKYANLIGRSPSALNMKVGNFGRLDPKLKEQGITGLANGSKMDEIIWNEFYGNWEELAIESERLIAQYEKKSLEEIAEIKPSELTNYSASEREAVVKQRINQNFFRSTILASYNLKCCLTGLSIPQFLVASHIKPWAKDKINRLNPHNGLCLNSIHDKAFDLGYMTITSEYKAIFSKKLNDFSNDVAVKDFFLKYENKAIDLPDRFLPDIEFLKYHYDNIFIK